jgi:hypothetical protein
MRRIVHNFDPRSKTQDPRYSIPDSTFQIPERICLTPVRHTTGVTHSRRKGRKEDQIKGFKQTYNFLFFFASFAALRETAIFKFRKIPCFQDIFLGK